MNLPGRRFVPGEIIYTDWFPRGADNMIIRGQTIDSESSPNVKIEVYTKNPDATSGQDGVLITQSGGSDFNLQLTSSTTAIETKVLVSLYDATYTEGLEQLVRFKIIVTGTGWLLARLFPPIFFDRAQPA